MIPCKGCGASLTYDIKSNSLACAYCGGHYDPYEFDGKTKDAEIQDIASALYVCPECGARLVTDRTDLTARCSYCGGANLIYNRMQHKLRPEAIIPFSITKEEATQRYLRKARLAFLSPRKYRNRSVLEDFRGIYMPFWGYEVSFDGKVRSEWRHSHTSGNYLITTTDTGLTPLKAKIAGYCHDASKSFDDTISECIVPYKLGDEKPFTPAYLCGLYADASDLSSNVYRQEAVEHASVYAYCRAKNEIDRKCAEVHLPPCETSARRVMYPVWFLSFRTNDSITYAAVNGSTGKVVADFPMSIPRIVLFASLLAAGIFYLLSLFTLFTPLITVIATTLITLVGLWRNWREFNQMYLRLSGEGMDKTISGKRIAVSNELSNKDKILFCILIFLAYFLCMIIGLASPPFLTLFVLFLTIAAITAISIISVFPGTGRRTGNHKRTLLWIAFCILVGSFSVIFGKPLNIYYYVWSMFCSAVFLFFFSYSLSYHSAFCKIRPPQFDKGGARK